MPGLLRELEGDRVVVAVDPGKVAHRVWLADRERGLIGEPVTVANSRSGIEQLAGSVQSIRCSRSKPLHRRLHDRLNALAPGLSAPCGHGRALALDTPTGRAVLACAVDVEGRAPSPRSLKARASGR